MNYLKLFNEEFESVESICKKFYITNYEIVDGLVNVNGTVRLTDKGLHSIPLKFGYVTGGFQCGHNLLTSLEGSPHTVGGSFLCNSNNLEKLDGGPKFVGGDVSYVNNSLISLDGSPKSIGGYFNCDNNQIMDFKIPEFSLNEDKDFSCRGNPIYEIYMLFNTPKCIDLINEYSVVQGDKVNMGTFSRSLSLLRYGNSIS